MICQVTVSYYTVMNKQPDNQELEHRIDLLEKDCKIMETNIDGTLKTLRADIDKTLQEMRTDAAMRETRLIITIAGLIVGGIAILGFILN